MRSLLLLFCFLIACQNPSSDKIVSDLKEPDNPSAISLSGKKLFPISESEATLSKKDSLLNIARENYENDPDNLENIIWYGRRMAYQYQYTDAIQIFTEGLKIYPNSPELFRHRGHRYISIRQFDKAITDFKKASENLKGRDIEIEADGIPNQLNIPLSNLQFNIYYHWALAHYLKGEFKKASELYQTCLEFSINPDLYTATADWLYMTYRRLGEHQNALDILDSVDEELEIIENESYYKRLLMYKGLLKPSELLDLTNQLEENQLEIVTQGYGVGNWHLYNGNKAQAKEIFSKILECQYWPAFGFIAAEAEIEGGNIML
jgi:tetratricopeptide (TPR) repeat protein